MVSRDEPDEGTNEMDATLSDRADNNLEASQSPLQRDGCLESQNSHTRCTIIRLTFGLVMMTPLLYSVWGKCKY